LLNDVKIFGPLNEWHRRDKSIGKCQRHKWLDVSKSYDQILYEVAAADSEGRESEPDRRRSFEQLRRGQGS
jgi:hypothetical protein